MMRGIKKLNVVEDRLIGINPKGAHKGTTFARVDSKPIGSLLCEDRFQKTTYSSKQYTRRKHNFQSFWGRGLLRGYQFSSSRHLSVLQL